MAGRGLAVRFARNERLRDPAVRLQGIWSAKRFGAFIQRLAIRSIPSHYRCDGDAIPSHHLCDGDASPSHSRDSRLSRPGEGPASRHGERGAVAPALPRPGRRGRSQPTRPGASAPSARATTGRVPAPPPWGAQRKPPLVLTEAGRMTDSSMTDRGRRALVAGSGNRGLPLPFRARVRAGVSGSRSAPRASGTGAEIWRRGPAWCRLNRARQGSLVPGRGLALALPRRDWLFVLSRVSTKCAGPSCATASFRQHLFCQSRLPLLPCREGVLPQ
jgi:hypothetical protein